MNPQGPLSKLHLIDVNGELIPEGAYTTALEYDGSNNPIYIGLAQTGQLKSAPAWLIRKLSFDSNNNVTDIQFASGSKQFNQVWNDRASLSYS
jgi:hypothetical protein